VTANKSYRPHTLLFLLAFAILTAPSAVSAEKVVYNEVPIHFLHYEIEQQQCIDMLDNIPSQYWSDIRSIKVYKRENVRYAGFYFWTKIIVLNQGCNFEVLIHELAHHKNNVDGVGWRESAKHGDTFMDAYQEISLAANDYQNQKYD
jgi:hypothetical protein